MAETVHQVGELIENRYRVLSVIGAGGMGILYRVSDEARDGEIVALKTVKVNRPDAQTPESVERFQREFQLLTQLRHPNLVSVYSYGVTTDGYLYFTMEWVQGQALDSQSFRQRPAAAIPIIVQICRALAYLHARGVAHGDLKPSNVLMLGEQVKIVDFGVALEARSPETRAHYYTPGYTAPEVKEQRPVDYRIDLYSLGALWYTLVMGEPPLFAPGADRLIRLALDEALESQEQVPAEIGAVIARLMATAPTDRYASADEVIEAINRVTGSAYALETRETASSYALRVHFVDRETEMGLLRTLWQQAQSDQGKLVLIDGEAGVGKTRLLEEFIVQAEIEGARVARGQCVEGGGGAYRPWREVLRVLIRYVESANEVVMRRVGPVLAMILPELWARPYMAGLAQPTELDPRAAQQRLNDAIIQTLRAAAEIRPTVIVIEDAHWADEATLALLVFLAQISQPARMLIAVTYGEEEITPEHSLAVLRAGVERVPLRALSSEYVTDLACSMLGLEELPPALMERIRQVTGGNAFFAQELIRALAEGGVVLQRTVEGWRVDEAALQSVSLPESIRQVVEQRLARLSAGAQQVLRWASIVGPIFWNGVVEAVGQIPRAQAQAALDAGLNRALLVERGTSAFAGEREYMFTNSTVRQVSYESVAPQDRQQVHSRAAAWLMARSEEEINEHLGLIAHHLEAAGQAAQAIDYLHRAGQQAAERFANAEAIAYLSRALDLMPENEPVKRYLLLLAREQAYDVQGAREAQRQDLAVLEKLAQALSDPRWQAEVALRRANYGEAIGDYPMAIAAARSAIDLAQAVRDVIGEAVGYQAWARALWRQGEFKAAEAQLEQAMTLARTTGERRIEAEGLLDICSVFAQQGNYAAARTYCEQALAICRETGTRRHEGDALNRLGLFAHEQGDYTGAQVFHQQALRLFREIGLRRGEGTVLLNLGRGSEFLGDYAQARAYYEQALRIGREIGNRESEGLVLFNLSALFHHLGDDDATRAYSQQALSLAREIGSRRTQGYALTSLGHALVGLGRPAEAGEFYQQAVALRRELGQHNLAMESLAGLARVSLGRGDFAQAQAQVEEILNHLETHTLEGAEEPFRIYLTCYRVLRANQDSRARSILNTAHSLLQEQAARITDKEMRRSFLENVAAHREIASEFAKSG